MRDTTNDDDDLQVLVKIDNLCEIDGGLRFREDSNAKRWTIQRFTDRGNQFTSWSFAERIREAGLLPSFGSVGDAFDNAMMESFLWSMQIELLDRKRWRTRLEMTTAIFDYVEVFYNRQRRHSSIDYVSPIDFEMSLTNQTA